MAREGAARQSAAQEDLCHRRTAMAHLASGHRVGTPQLAPSVGMRVCMADGYKDQGHGAIIGVPEHGVCSVAWDSGLTEVLHASCP